MLKLGFVFLIYLCAPAFAVGLPRYGIFDYADMCYSSVDGAASAALVIVSVAAATAAPINK
jgi:hypothetical protein